jgi:CPA2 family monovalent cation:H+ antiporter-2
LDPIIGITILLAAALVGGIIALRLKQPVILGYLIIGVVAGPHALGLLNDVAVIETAATIGVALLMFSLGLELSFGQLQVGKIGTWGSLLQILVTVILGVVVALTLLHWSLPQSILFGFIIYSASTAMCLKVLMDRGELDSVHGRIVMAVAIFQDIAAVVMILILPFLGQSGGSLIPDVFIAIGKILAFLAAALVVGLWVLPWLLGKIGGVQPRELFLLTVLVLAMGAAISTYEFGLPSVFGAFLIGFILRQLKFTNQAMAEVTPFRDVFAAIFFVSMGMLLDVHYVWEHWQSLAIMVPAIVALKLAVVFGITWWMGYGKRVALMSGVALYHVGEFGFIIAQSGLSSGIITDQMYSLLIASAIITMLLMPSTMNLASWAYKKYSRQIALTQNKRKYALTERDVMQNPVIVAGYGRVGQGIVHGLRQTNIPFTVIEMDPEHIPDLRRRGITHIYGDSSNGVILAQAGAAQATTMIITYPDELAISNTVRNVYRINPQINIIARVHRLRDYDLFRELGVKNLISPEYEASLEFLKRCLASCGMSQNEIEKTCGIINNREEEKGKV